MELILIITMFVMTLLSLNYISNERYKLASACNVITLCLIVAAAYQFELTQGILTLLVFAIVVVVGIKGAMMYSKSKKER